MNISDIIKKLEDIKKEHGDLTLCNEYYCHDCLDVHDSDRVEVSVIDGDGENKNFVKIRTLELTE